MRDDFSKETIATLAKRAGMRCSHCRRLTSGPNDDPATAVNLGVAAHIAAASEGGPRYDLSMTPAQRASISNGIWLCQTCAKLVDSDVKKYPATLLLRWKEAGRSGVAGTHFTQPRL